MLYSRMFKNKNIIFDGKVDAYRKRVYLKKIKHNARIILYKIFKKSEKEYNVRMIENEKIFV